MNIFQLTSFDVGLASSWDDVQSSTSGWAACHSDCAGSSYYIAAGWSTPAVPGLHVVSLGVCSCEFEPKPDNLVQSH